MSERILFVDDDANILAAYVRTLRSFRGQFAIGTAQGGKEGLAKIASEEALSPVDSCHLR